MEVILLDDVKGLGKKGETANVSDGYGTNFLIRKGLAVRKTPDALNELKREQKKEAEHQAELKAEAEKNKVALEKITLEFTAKAAKDGRMIGEISTKEVARVLESQYIKKQHREYVNLLIRFTSMHLVFQDYIMNSIKELLLRLKYTLVRKNNG